MLRVALKDPNFFSSRRHPVRRFINRVSTLAAGFSAFEGGPAKEFLARVTDLVKDIVEGDFDQLDTYNEKLLDLERFIEEQARAEVEATPAAETIKVKELEWKQQQQFSTQLLAALEALAMPAYLKEFISKVWGRVILAVSQRDGEESPNAQRFRKAAFDLVVSIQPKRSIEQRSRFLSTLPGLMATLNEGMKLIDWPEQDNTAFFGKLLAEHAGSLKTAPASELDYNLLLRGVEAAAKTPLPTKEEVETIDIELGDGTGHRAAVLGRGSQEPRPHRRQRGRLAGAHRDHARRHRRACFRYARCPRYPASPAMHPPPTTTAPRRPPKVRSCAITSSSASPTSCT